MPKSKKNKSKKNIIYNEKLTGKKNIKARRKFNAKIKYKYDQHKYTYSGKLYSCTTIVAFVGQDKPDSEWREATPAETKLWALANRERNKSKNIKDVSFKTKRLIDTDDNDLTKYIKAQGFDMQLITLNEEGDGSIIVRAIHGLCLFAHPGKRYISHAGPPLERCDLTGPVQIWDV